MLVCRLWAFELPTSRRGERLEDGDCRSDGAVRKPEGEVCGGESRASVPNLTKVGVVDKGFRSAFQTSNSMEKLLANLPLKLSGES